MAGQRFNSGQVSDWGATQKTFLNPQTLKDYWQPSPYVGAPAGTAWPIINRIYYTLFKLPDDFAFSLVGINVTASGAATTDLRLGLLTDNNGSPGTVLEQTTVTNDIGAKTCVLNNQYVFKGFFWLAAGPQGSGSVGSAWLSSGNVGLTPNNHSGSTYNGTNNFQIRPFSSESGAIPDNPSVGWDQTARTPFFVVRKA